MSNLQYVFMSVCEMPHRLFRTEQLWTSQSCGVYCTYTEAPDNANHVFVCVKSVLIFLGIALSHSMSNVVKKLADWRVYSRVLVVFQLKQMERKYMNF